MPAQITQRLDSTLSIGLDGYQTAGGSVVLNADHHDLEYIGGESGRLWLIFPAVELPKYHRVQPATLQLTLESNAPTATLTVRAFAERDPAPVGSAEDIDARTYTAPLTVNISNAWSAGDTFTVVVTELVNALLEQFPADSQPRGIGFLFQASAAGDVTVSFEGGSHATEASRPLLTIDPQNILNVWEGDADSSATQITCEVLIAISGAVYQIEIGTAVYAYTATTADTTATIAAALAGLLGDPDTGIGEVAYTGGATFTWTSDTVGEPTDVAVLTGGAAYVVNLVTGAAAVAQQIDLILPPTTTGGTWDLSIDFGGGDETLSTLAHNISAAALETAIDGLTTPAPDDVTVEKVSAYTWRLTLAGNLLGTNATATIDDTNLTQSGPGADVTLTNQQAAAPAGPAYDLAVLEEIGPVINPQTFAYCRRRFRLAGGPWSPWITNWSSTQIETALKALVDPGDAATVNVECSTRGANFESRLAAIKLPTGYEPLEIETDSPGYIFHLLTPVSTADHSAAALIVPFGAADQATPHRVSGTITTDTGVLNWETETATNDKDTLIEQLDAALGAGNYVLTTPQTFTTQEMWHYVLTLAGDYADHAATFAAPLYGPDPGTPGNAYTVAAGDPPANQIDRLEYTTNGVEFTISVNGIATPTLTTPVTAADIDAALAALNGDDNSICSDVTAGTVDIEWIGVYRGQAVTVALINSEGTAGDAVVSIARVGSAAVNAKQRIVMDAEAYAGTITATVPGVPNAPSNPIPFDADAATVDAALEAHIAAGNCVVTGSAGGPWDVEFTNALAAMPLGLIELDQSQLKSDAALLALEIVDPGGGPGRWDTAANWSLAAVPATHHVVSFADGDQDCEGGYVQQADFTVDTLGTAYLSVPTPIHLAAGQIVRLRSTGTLPTITGGTLSPDTDYQIKSCNRVRGILTLGPVSGATAYTCEDAGEGVHTLGVQLRAFHHHMPCRAALGLARRDPDGLLETRPQFLTVGFLASAGPNVLLGIGEGAGSQRLNFDFGRSPAHVQVLNSGNSSSNAAPILLRNATDALTVEVISGEAGLAQQVGESARFEALTVYGGALTLGRDVAAAPDATIDVHAAGELLAEELTTLNATLRIR